MLEPSEFFLDFSGPREETSPATVPLEQVGDDNNILLIAGILAGLSLAALAAILGSKFIIGERKRRRQIIDLP